MQVKILVEIEEGDSVNECGKDIQGIADALNIPADAFLTTDERTYTCNLTQVRENQKKEE